MTDIKSVTLECIPPNEWDKLSVNTREDIVEWLDKVDEANARIESKVDALAVQLKDPYEVARRLLLLCEPKELGGAEHPLVLAHGWVEQAAIGLGEVSPKAE